MCPVSPSRYNIEGGSHVDYNVNIRDGDQIQHVTTTTVYATTFHRARA